MGQSKVGREAVERAGWCMATGALLWATGCTGLIGGEQGRSGPDGPGASAGASNAGGSGPGTAGSGNLAGGQNPDAGSPIQAAPTWRLTNREYVSSVRDLLGVTVTTPLDPDGAAAGYRAGLAAGDRTVEAYYTAAVEAAASADLLALVPCDAAAVAATPSACAEELIDTLARKAFRRTPDAETSAALLALFELVSAQYGFEAGVQAVVEQLLQSPYFLYHLELEEQAQGPGAVKVAGYSMASRLSYLIWGTTPDDTLLDKAEAGELSTPEQIKAEAARLIADPRAAEGLRTFYEQWLHADTLPPVKTGKYTGVYDAAMRASILASFTAQVDASLWSPNGVALLMGATQAFANEHTAPLFGVAGVTGTELRVVDVNPQERVGILGHPAIMGAIATENGTNPIRRGVFVWDQLLCQELPSPPTDVPVFPGIPENASVRTAFETFTSDTKCQGCHRMINPVGFLFENYDTLGAYTAIDDNGQPVMASGTINGAPDEALNVPTATAADLGRNLANSGVVAACLVKQLYRYTTKRHETSGDEASIHTLAELYATTAQSMPELLGGLTQSEAFLNRWNQE